MENNENTQAPRLPSEFFGREEELNELLRCWQSAKPGNPAWVTIAAESGYGKTRLVQEFYARLARLETVEEPSKTPYWPAELPVDGLRLALNPHFTQHPDNTVREIPWLWWGIRGQDPSSTNPTESESAIDQAREHLEPHLVRFDVSEAKKEAGFEVFKKVAIVASNILFHGLLEALLSCAELINSRKHVKDALKLQAAAPANRKSKLQVDASTELLEVIQKFIAELPVVLVLDDLHFFDAASLRFVNQLVLDCNKKKHPFKLMIVSTVWRREWLKDEYQGDNPLSNWKFSQTNIELKPLDLVAATQLLSKFFPELEKEDKDFLAALSGGNLRYLMEIVREVTQLGNRRLYFDSERKTKLSDSGRERLKAKEVAFATLVEKRISSLDEDIQIALELGSFQGAQFDENVVGKVQQRLIPSAKSDEVKSAIQKGETPGAVITSAGQDIKEFLAGPYQQIFLARMKQTRRIEDVSAAYKMVCLPETGNISNLSPKGRDLFSKFVAEERDPAKKIHGLTELMFDSLNGRDFERALKQVVQIGRAGFEVRSDTIGSALANISAPPSPDWLWPGERVFQIKTNISALSVICHFGFQPPSHFTQAALPESLEKMGEEIATHLTTQYGQLEDASSERPLDQLIVVSEALYRFHDLFCHSEFRYQWALVRAALFEELRESSAQHPLDSVLVDVLLTQLKAIELKCLGATTREEFEKIFESYSRLGKLKDDFQNKILKELVWPLVQAHILIFGKAGWRYFSVSETMALKNQLPNDHTRAAEILGEVLADLVLSTSEPRNDKISFAELATALEENEEAIQAVFFAGSLVVEIALENNFSLARAFADRLFALAQGQVKSMAEGAYCSLDLAGAAIEALLGVTEFYLRQYTRHSSGLLPRYTADQSEQFRVVNLEDLHVTGEDLDRALTTLWEACKRYRRLAPGHVPFMTLETKIGLLVQIHKTTFKKADPEVGTAEDIFLRAIEYARLTNDSERAACGEKVEFLPLLVRLFDTFLVGASNAPQNEALMRETYSDLESERYDYILEKIRQAPK